MVSSSGLSAEETARSVVSFDPHWRMERKAHLQPAWLECASVPRDFCRLPRSSPSVDYPSFE